ncbi:MAG TPA: type II CAAX endopeptidase family protein [Candidatus Angelobacter sp.]|nr:type II CAAX endopeptidase family protein [Candidatus Angelobacter sp.]
MQTPSEELQPQPAIHNSPFPSLPAYKQRLIAPLWHTILFILILFGNSYLTAITLPKIATGASSKQHTFEYLFTIGWELFLLLIVWIGIRMRGVTFRDLIGGRWNRFEDFFIDLTIAGGGVVAAYIVVGVASIFLGLARPERMQESRKLADMLAPSSLQSLAAFILLSAFAGVIEEILFRGYLQKQFAALTGKGYLGLIIQAAVFGLGHGYEGWQRMVGIFCLGCFFGILALLRKSLRPGMMTHAIFDSLQGIALYALKKGLLRVP